MNIRADASGFITEQQRSAKATANLTKAAKDRVKIVSLKVLREIKLIMPVATGAARARWGIAGAPGGVWEELDGGLTITQGADLEPYEYIERLNEGSSQQAPAGFLDVEEARGAEELEQGLAEDAARLL